MTEVRFGSVEYRRTELIRIRRVHFQLTGTGPSILPCRVALLELQGHASRGVALTLLEVEVFRNGFRVQCIVQIYQGMTPLDLRQDDINRPLEGGGRPQTERHSQIAIVGLDGTRMPSCPGLPRQCLSANIPTSHRGL